MGRIGWCELVILVVIVITEVNSQGCSAEINVCGESSKEKNYRIFKAT